MNHFSEKVSFIWSVADLLRGNYKQSEYGRVILPFTVLRRLDQVLEPTKKAVMRKSEELGSANPTVRDRMLRKAAKASFYNTSPFDFQRLFGDASHAAANLSNYMTGFSPNPSVPTNNGNGSTCMSAWRSGSGTLLVSTWTARNRPFQSPWRESHTRRGRKSSVQRRLLVTSSGAPSGHSSWIMLPNARPCTAT